MLDADRAWTIGPAIRSARLSGGNRQRVNIAIGLLAEPAVLLLDEPSASLDPRQRERLWEFISALAAEGTTVVYSTHNVGEVERYATRVLLLADGELLFTGTPADLHAAVDGGGRRRRLVRGRARPLPARPRPLGVLMRWLLIKDLQILRRSPLLDRAAHRLPGRDRADDRLCPLQPAGQAQGGLL